MGLTTRESCYGWSFSLLHDAYWESESRDAISEFDNSPSPSRSYVSLAWNKDRMHRTVLSMRSTRRLTRSLQCRPRKQAEAMRSASLMTIWARKSDTTMSPGRQTDAGLMVTLVWNQVYNDNPPTPNGGAL